MKDGWRPIPLRFGRFDLYIRGLIVVVFCEWFPYIAVAQDTYDLQVQIEPAQEAVIAADQWKRATVIAQIKAKGKTITAQPGFRTWLSKVTVDADGLVHVRLIPAALPEEECVLEVGMAESQRCPFSGSIRQVIQRDRLQTLKQPIRLPVQSSSIMEFRLMSSLTSMPGTGRKVGLSLKEPGGGSHEVAQVMTDDNGYFAFRIGPEKEYDIFDPDDGPIGAGADPIPLTPVVQKELREPWVITTKPLQATLRFMIRYNGRGFSGA